MARFDLTDEEWAIIEPFLPPQGRGPEPKDDRKILNGIFYILRTGARGVISLSDMDRARQSTIATTDGVNGGCGASFLRRSPRNAERRSFLSTLPS